MSEQKNQGGQQRGQDSQPGRGQQQSGQQTPKPGEKGQEGVVPEDKMWENGGLGT